MPLESASKLQELCERLGHPLRLTNELAASGDLSSEKIAVEECVKNITDLTQKFNSASVSGWLMCV